MKQGYEQVQVPLRAAQLRESADITMSINDNSRFEQKADGAKVIRATCHKGNNVQSM